MPGRNVSSALGSDRLHNRSRKPFFSLLPFLCLTLLLLFCFTGWVSAKEAKPKLQPWHINGILAALDDSYPGVQSYALGQLAKYDSKDVKVALKNPEEIAKKVANILQDKRQADDVRGSAAEALGNLGDAAKPYIKDLLNILQDKTQHPTVRSSAAEALGNLGDAAKPYIKDLLNILQDKTQDPTVRGSAAVALTSLGDAAKPYIKDLLNILQDKTQGFYDFYGRGSAAEALGNLGDAAKPYIKDLLNFIQDKTQGSYERSSAAKALVNLGDTAKPYVKDIANILQDKTQDPTVRSSAAEALGNLGDAAKPYIKDLLNILQDKTQHRTVRSSAAVALTSLGDAAKPYIKDLLNFIQDKRQAYDVRGSAAVALGNLGDVAKPYIKDLLNIIQDKTQDSSVRGRVAVALVNLGDAAKPYIKDIANFLQDEPQDSYVNGRVAEALGSLGDAAKPYIKDLLNILQDKRQDKDVRGSAAVALGNLGDAAKPYIKDIANILQDKPQDSDVRGSAAETLSKLEKLSLDNVVSVLNVVYEGDALVNQWRFYTYFLGGGDEDVKRLLQWVGKPKELPAQLTHDAGKQTLEVFEKAWNSSEKLPDLRRDLANKIARVTKMVTWQPNDIVLLQSHFSRLKSGKYDEADSIQAVITHLEGWKWVFVAWRIILAHIAFWLALILFYSKYAWIQAVFFWNPWVRNIIGLGYVSFLLTWLPFLRHKLFEPFKTPFLSDAGLINFIPDAYFPNSDVSLKGTDDLQTITVIFPSIQGQQILEGDSGLGKTMFLRHLLTQSKRIVVYLPATKCAEGVIEAIQKKLHGDEIKDPKFLQSLIYSGAIDICIDGLNEVNPDTRAKITQFVESHFKGNILMTTQPLEWTPPSTAKTYVIQPLRLEQIDRYLTSRQPFLPKSAIIQAGAYEPACHNFLKTLLGDKTSLSPEECKTAQAILSNPMELTLAAWMLAGGIQPDLFNLREQQYKLMADEYQTIQKHDFPLKKFSEAVYQRWLTDEKSLPANDFYNELLCMEDEKYRMVVRRQWQDAKGEVQKEWFFRHDKIAEFFIVQTFLGESKEAKKRLKQHINDSRFRGVYFLLATLLPLDAAQQLREDLIQNAADTNDHTVSDTFVRLLRLR